MSIPTEIRARGTIVRTLSLLALLVACEASEHGNPEQTLPADAGPDAPFGNAPSSDMPGGSCARELWLRPEEPRTRYSCEIAGGETASGPVEWRCTCGDEERSAPWRLEDWAPTLCEQILADSCEIDLDQRNFCEHPSGGTCWPDPTREDGWDCACGEQPESSALVAVRAERCETAAFTHCASACEDLTGRCEPIATGDRFDCECDYFAVPRETPAARCELALAGCNPELNDLRDAAGLACSGFAGFCDQTDSELSCTCFDGSTHARPLTDLVEQSAEACSGMLHELCGDGLSQREAFQCSLEKADGRQCYASLRFAVQRYDCNCQSENACNEEYDIRQSVEQAATCAEALAACSTADDLFERPEVPACTPDPGPRSCSGPGRDERSCLAYLTTEGHYRCECFTDDGLTEVDIWNDEIEAERCDTALSRCTELDPP